jgi:TRAP-type uncharacterized transport system substrate-binding protein
MTDKIRVSSMKGGGQWWKSIQWAGKAFGNSDFEVETTRLGEKANDPLMRVARGEADVAVTLSVAAAQAAKGVGVYKNGEASSICSLAHLVRPDQHFFNMVRADLGIRSFTELVKRKPALDVSIELPEYGPGHVTEVYLRHYGIDLMHDIPAWGGSFITSHPGTVPLVLEGKCNAIMRTDTMYGPAGIAAHVSDWVLLPLDRDIAEMLERDYCTPIAMIEPGFMRGLKEDGPVLTVTNPGFDLIVNSSLPDDVAYRLAKALNETNEKHWASQDVFYSILHAPRSLAPLHPGAARYYREQGVLK